MDGLKAFMGAAHAVQMVFKEWDEDGVPTFAKGDHEKAYRQWPVHPEDGPCWSRLCGMTLSATTAGT